MRTEAVSWAAMVRAVQPGEPVRRYGPGARWVPVFAILTFAITIGAGIPVLLSDRATLIGAGIAPPNSIVLPLPAALLLLIVSRCGPALAALATAGLSTGGDGFGSLLGQLRRWKVSPRWYLIALAAPILLGLASVLLARTFERTPPDRWLAASPPWELGLTLLYSIGQELGWRGYALPALSGRTGPLLASALIGVLWFAWREWTLVTTNGRFLVVPFGVVMLLVLIVAVSIFIGWLYTATQGSLPIAWIANFSFLFISAILVFSFLEFAVFVALFAAVAAALVLLKPSESTRATPAA